MNWQEVVNGNQQQAKTNVNNQLGGAIPYMPLIFNQRNPAGAALSLALGNLINDAIGKRNDRHNVPRFANAKAEADQQFAINPVQPVTPTEGMTEEQIAEANRNNAINNARNIRSSGDYYNALVDAAVRNGASRAKAEKWAAKEAGVYQDNANKAYQNLLNQYGYSEDGALNSIGTEALSLLSNEGRGDYAKMLLNTSATPKDSLANRWAIEKENRALANQKELAEYQAALRAAYGGGNGISKQEKTYSPMDIVKLELDLTKQENELREAGATDEQIEEKLGDAKRFIYNIKHKAETDADVMALIDDPSNDKHAWAVITDAISNPNYKYKDIKNVIDFVSAKTGMGSDYYFNNIPYEAMGLDKNKLAYVMGIEPAKPSGGSTSGGGEQIARPQYTKEDWRNVVNNAGGNGWLDQLIEYNKSIGKK